MTIKQFMGITMLSIVGLGSSTYANTVENVAPQQVITEEGFVLTKNTAINSMSNVSAVLGTQIIEENIITNVDKKEGLVSCVVVDEATVRREPSPDSDIINFIAKDVPVFVTKRIDNWYHIQIEGIDGYIYKDQLNEDTLGLIPYTKTAVEEPEQAETYLGEEVIAYAKQFLGNPYVYGGNSLTKGADCSGFVQQVYKNFDISLQRSSRSQFASNGTKVSKNDLLPGDLIFYGYNGNIDHVAIYAGNGSIIHASTPKTGITMGELNYGKPIIGIKRVI
ncbi:NlpC/P60 family protein [Niameybacter massiliensis]|uniref:NlpC/P60 family protein n=1 Tax=Holtiella tumoricola TaxID=3018743 RepID=A0AA42DSR1_9FIRM|nr:MULTISPECIES: NlpC/P60 family protein [Lachnospirales]MDA3734173.1 NlpC/P60 family protein [Holtiella tumoricola]